MATKQELANRKARGELVPADRVRRDSFELARMTRDRILGVPARVSAELLALRDQSAIEVRLEDALREALTSLADEIESER
jgi:hypothetical protein